MKNLDVILNDLKKISQSPFVNDGNGVGISLSTNNFQYHWFLNNDEKQFSNYSTEVKDPEIAYKIIQEFSGESLDDVRKNMSRISQYDQSKPLYLHFIKSIKHL